MNKTIRALLAIGSIVCLTAASGCPDSDTTTDTATGTDAGTDTAAQSPVDKLADELEANNTAGVTAQCDCSVKLADNRFPDCTDASIQAYIKDKGLDWPGCYRDAYKLDEAKGVEVLECDKIQMAAIKACFDACVDTATLFQCTNDANAEDCQDKLTQAQRDAFQACP